MLVLSVMNQKGGCGKSVLTVLLANTLSVDFGLKVMIIEVDEQQTILDVRKMDREYETDFPYPIEVMPIWVDMGKKKEKVLQDFLDKKFEEDEYDLILVDIPGRTDDKMILHALALMDAFLIPLVSDTADRNATLNFCITAKQMQIMNQEIGKELDIWGVRNRLRNRYEEKDFEAFCNQIDLPLFDSSLRELVAYSRFNTYEGFVSNPVHKKDVREEVQAFAKEFINRFDLPVYA